MRRVLVGTPAYDGRVEGRYVSSLIESIDLCSKKDIFLRPVFLSYDALIQRARNDLFALAVDSKVDDLIWIDSDVVWKPNWIPELLEKPVDVVGLAVVKKSVEAEQYNVKCAPERLKADGTGLVPVEGLGTGFLRMSKKAIDAVWNSSPVYKDQGRDRRSICEVQFDNGDMISEDIVLCRKLWISGIPVYLDPSKTCGHVGTALFWSDFSKFARRISEAKMD